MDRGDGSDEEAGDRSRTGDLGLGKVGGTTVGPGEPRRTGRSAFLTPVGDGGQKHNLWHKGLLSLNDWSAADLRQWAHRLEGAA